MATGFHDLKIVRYIKSMLQKRNYNNFNDNDNDDNNNNNNDNDNDNFNDNDNNNNTNNNNNNNNNTNNNNNNNLTRNLKTKHPLHYLKTKHPLRKLKNKQPLHKLKIKLTQQIQNTKPVRYLNTHHTEIMDFRSDMKRMVLPVMVEQLAAVMMNLISTIISSQLGKEAISAIGSVSTLNLLVISVFSSLATGGTVVVAQYVGRGDREKINKTVITGLLSTGILVSLLVVFLLLFKTPIIHLFFGGADPEVIRLAIEYLTAISFYFLPFGLTSMGLALLRGAGDMKTPMQVSLITNIISAIISYPLIYGFAKAGDGKGLGVSGAAIAMAISQTIGLAMVLFIIIHGHRNISLKEEKSIKISLPILKNILFFSLPAGAEQLMFNGGKLLVQTFIMGLGTAAIAANSIVNSLSSLISVGSNSLAILATSLIGQLVGAGHKEKARTWNLFLMIFACGLNVIAGLIFLLLSGILPGAYTNDPETIELSRQLLIVYIFVLPLLHAPSFVLPSGFRGAGDVRYTMVISMISMWTMRVAASYFLIVVLNLGVHGVWIGMYLDWLLRSIFFVPRALGRKWLQHKSIT